MKRVYSASTHEYYETLEHPYEEEVLGNLIDTQTDVNNLIKDMQFFEYEGNDDIPESETYRYVLRCFEQLHNDLVELQATILDAIDEIENILKED